MCDVCDVRDRVRVSMCAMSASLPFSVNYTFADTLWTRNRIQNSTIAPSISTFASDRILNFTFIHYDRRHLSVETTQLTNSMT